MEREEKKERVERERENWSLFFPLDIFFETLKGYVFFFRPWSLVTMTSKVIFGNFEWKKGESTVRMSFFWLRWTDEILVR